MKAVFNKQRNKNKNIYIVLTHTGSLLSRIIKLYTKAEFSHVSISLDEGLNEMYSFGRLKPYNPFIGGFVHESIRFGTFKRFQNTKAEIYSITLTNKQYETIKRTIKKMKKKRKLYTFNIVGLFAIVFNIKYKKENSFYCAEFIKFLIDKARLEVKLPELVKPNDFKNIDSIELKYHGILKNYEINNQS